MFFLDLKSLSDEELLTKLMELSKKLVWASRFSGYEVVGQLQDSIRYIENERRERILMANAPKSSIITETDPDLAEENKQSETIEQNKIAQKNKIPARERLRPTTKPVNPSN